MNLVFGCEQRRAGPLIKVNTKSHHPTKSMDRFPSKVMASSMEKLRVEPIFERI